MLLMLWQSERGLLTIGERCSRIMAKNSGLHHSEAFLKKRLYIDRKSPDDIAKECGVSLQIIYRQMKKFGLK